MAAESQLNCPPAWARKSLVLITGTSSLKGQGKNGIKQKIENTRRSVSWGQGLESHISVNQRNGLILAMGRWQSLTGSLTKHFIPSHVDSLPLL